MVYYKRTKLCAFIRFFFTRTFLKTSFCYNLKFKGTNWIGKKSISIGKNNRFYPYSEINAGLNRNMQTITIGNNNEFDIYSVLFSHGGYITLGNGNYIGPRVQIQGKGSVTIGNNCLIAGNTFIVSSNHDISNPEIGDYRKEIGKPIVIEDGVWIGANCVIVAGTTVNKGAIIGAGSIVTKDVPAYTIIAGNPAKSLKKFDPKIKKWITT